MKQTLKRVSQCLYRSAQTKIYYARARRSGKLITQSLQTRSQEVAKWKLGQFLGKTTQLKPGLTSATVQEVIDLFKETALAAKNLKPGSREDYAYRLKALIREWPRQDLARSRLRDVGVGDCERWFAKRKTMVGAQRLKNERNLLIELFEFAIREGYTMTNPAKKLAKIRVPKSKVVPPTRAQFKKLLEHFDKTGNVDAQEFVELLAYSGLRRNEAATLRWCDVLFDRNRFRVAGKGREADEFEEVPLFPSLRELLLRIRDRRVSVQSTERILCINQCRDALRRACRARGLPEFTHHDMRHYFCSEAIEKGIDFKVIAGWLRHKDGGFLVATTYGHLRQDHSDDMAAKMTFNR
jgi:integrase